MNKVIALRGTQVNDKEVIDRFSLLANATPSSLYLQSYVLSASSTMSWKVFKKKQKENQICHRRAAHRVISFCRCVIQCLSQIAFEISFIISSSRKPFQRRTYAESSPTPTAKNQFLPNVPTSNLNSRGTRGLPQFPAYPECHYPTTMTALYWFYYPITNFTPPFLHPILLPNTIAGCVVIAATH